MKYPEWTPPALADDELCAKHFRRAREIRIAYRLATDSRMENVWSELDKHCKPEYQATMPIWLVKAVADAWAETIKGRLHEKQTRGDEHKNLVDIKRDARALALALEKSRMPSNPFYWLDDRLIEPFVERGIIDTHRDTRPFGLSPKQNCCDYFLNASHEDCPDSLAAMLLRLSDEAGRYADEAKTRPRLNSNKNVSDTTLFVRCLYKKYWKITFGQQLYGTFANLCNVVFDRNDVGEGHLKDIFKLGGGVN